MFNKLDFGLRGEWRNARKRHKMTRLQAIQWVWFLLTAYSFRKQNRRSPK